MQTMLVSIWCLAILLLAVLVSCHAPPQSFAQIPLGISSLDRDIPVSRVLAEEWDALNKSVGGRLSSLSNLPLGLPCYDNYNGKPKQVDPLACSEVEKNKNNSDWLTEQVGGYVQGNWVVCQRSGYGCPISPFAPIVPSAPCWQGNLPPVYLEVESVEDAETALGWATKNQVRVGVKNTGHDYKGRSAGPVDLLLWTHQYQPPITLDTNFTPDGCPSPVGDAITFGAGQGWDGVYAFAGNHGLTVVGGSSETVGPAGGWITGGGHSGLSPVYGLGVDNVLQLGVVLPNGTYVTANRCQNQDVFFAQCGGGGGTFGVNMHMSTAAHPSTPVQWVEINFPNLTTGSQGTQRQLLDVLVSNANAWFDAGWGGYAYPAGQRPNNMFPVQLMNPLLNQSQALQSLQPLWDFATSLHMTPEITTYPSYYELYQDKIKGALKYDGNLGIAMSSRLVPRSNFEGASNQTQLATTIMDAMENSGDDLMLMLLLVTPSQGIPDSGSSSVTPAWRSSTWHVIYQSIWDPARANATQTQAMFETVSRAMDPLRSITPDGGAYLNEGDTFEPDPVAAFWGGDNYKRLLAIKQEMDPGNILQVHGGVGWNSSEELFACYPAVN